MRLTRFKVYKIPKRRWSTPVQPDASAGSALASSWLSLPSSRSSSVSTSACATPAAASSLAKPSRWRVRRVPQPCYAIGRFSRDVAKLATMTALARTVRADAFLRMMTRRIALYYMFHLLYHLLYFPSSLFNRNQARSSCAPSLRPLTSWWAL